MAGDRDEPTEAQASILIAKFGLLLTSRRCGVSSERMEKIAAGGGNPNHGRGPYDSSAAARIAIVFRQTFPD